jgi:hypothetical protein
MYLANLKNVADEDKQKKKYINKTLGLLSNFKLQYPGGKVVKMDDKKLKMGLENNTNFNKFKMKIDFATS